MGTVSITFSGTPGGVGRLFGADQAIPSGAMPQPAGPLDLVAASVVTANEIVRTIYEPTTVDQQICVRAGQTTAVEFSYTRLATSGRVWFGATGATANATLLGYDPASLAATGTAAAALAIDLNGSGGFTFDQVGGVWVPGATLADPPLARYSADALGPGGARTPAYVIDSPSLATNTPGLKVVALDANANLWVSVEAANKVVMFRSGDPLTGPAFIEQTGIDTPSGLAFDKTGSLWVASGGSSTVIRLYERRVDLTIAARSAAPATGTLSHPSGLAFDAAGNLWVSYDGTIASLGANVIAIPPGAAAAGTMTVAPAIQLAVSELATPSGLAFDESGGLWFANKAGKFARLAPSQLAASGSPVPERVIAGSDLGLAGWVAIYPAPAFTPLAHRMP
jgi:sugar lactone lactonase YvrE